jgi:hypothetical protein
MIELKSQNGNIKKHKAPQQLMNHYYNAKANLTKIGSQYFMHVLPNHHLIMILIIWMINNTW